MTTCPPSSVSNGMLVTAFSSSLGLMHAVYPLMAQRERERWLIEDPADTMTALHGWPSTSRAFWDVSERVHVPEEADLDRGLDELSQFFVGDKSMLDTLHRVADLAVESMESAEYASVTMVVDGDVRTGVFTNDDAREIDRTQYESGEGPCLDAFRTGEIYRITSTTET